jgi:hypothetical protein
MGRTSSGVRPIPLIFAFASTIGWGFMFWIDDKPYTVKSASKK